MLPAVRRLLPPPPPRTLLASTMNMPLVHGTTQGRPALFQGTSPGDRGPGFPYGSMAPSRVVNQTIGWQTNYTVPYAYVVRRFKNDADESLNKGQYVWMRRKTMPLSEKRLHTLVNLPQINHLLYTCRHKSVDDALYDPFGAFDRGTAKPGVALSLLRVLEEWTPHGVVQGEIGGSRHDQPQERLINLIVEGRSPVINVWGASAICDTTPLWFVLMPVQLTSHDSRCFQTKLDEFSVMKDDNKDHNRYCWQWMAYGDSKCHNPYDVKSSVMEKVRATVANKFGIDVANNDTAKAVLTAVARQFMAAVYVGRVSSKGYLTSHGTVEQTVRAHFNINRLVTLPQFEMFVDYSGDVTPYLVGATATEIVAVVAKAKEAASGGDSDDESDGDGGLDTAGLLVAARAKAERLKNDAAAKAAELEAAQKALEDAEKVLLDRQVESYALDEPDGTGEKVRSPDQISAKAKEVAAAQKVVADARAERVAARAASTAAAEAAARAAATAAV
jgi:hypothetical protein